MVDGKGFIVDLLIKICLPIDSETYCIPQDGFHILQQQEFPVCSQDFYNWMKGIHVKTFHNDSNIGFYLSWYAQSFISLFIPFNT